MNVTIVYYGQARQIAGLDRETVEVPEAAPVAEAIARAAEAHGQELTRLLFTEDNALRRSALITVNGAAANGAAAPLQANAEIGVFPALAGG